MSERYLLYPPERPIRLSLEWRTDVMVSRSGSERRHALRANPRWMFELKYKLLEADARALRWRLAQDMEASWKVPVWHKPSPTTDAVEATDTTIPGDFSRADLAATDEVYVLAKDGTYGEIATVTAIAGGLDSIDIDSGLANGYEAGSKVYLVVDSMIRQGQGMLRWPVNLTEMDLVADVRRHRSAGGAAGVVSLYRGLPILDRRVVGLRFLEQYESGHVRIDFGGRVNVQRGWDVGRTTYPRRLFLRGRDDLADAEALLAELVGMREQLWVPTWTPDFSLLGVSPGASSATVADLPSGYVEAWFAAEQNPSVQFYRADTGDVVRRHVLDVTDLGGATLRLDFDSPLPADMPGLTDLTLSLVQLCRLGNDGVKIEYGNKGYADVVLRTLDEAPAIEQFDASVAETVEVAESVAAAAAVALAESEELSESVDVRTLANLSETTEVEELVQAAVLAQLAEALELAEDLDVELDPETWVILPADDSVAAAAFTAIDGFALAVAASTKFMVWGFAFFDASDGDVTSGMQFDGPASNVRFLAHYGFPGLFNRWPLDYNAGTGAAGFTGRGVAMFRILFETGGTAGTLQYKTRSTDGTDSIAYPRGCWIAARSVGLVELGGDVTNSGASSGTLADITAFQLAVASGVLYWYRFWVAWTATATTTGYRLAVNGPTFTVCVTMVQIKIAANSQVRGCQAGYDDAGPVGTDSVAGENFAYMEGVILPTASGNLIARHAAEANSLSVTAEAGSVADLIPLVAGDPRVGIAGGDVTDNVGTLKDLTDCFVDVAADEEIAFEIRVPCRTDTGTTGIGFGLDCPGDYEELEAEVRIATTTAAITVGRLGAPGDRVDCASMTANTDRLAIITGYFRNGPTPGQLQVQFAREAAAGAGTVTAKANSAIRKTVLS